MYPSLYFAVCAAIACSVVNLAYAATRQRRRSKKPLRIIIGLATLYFLFIYIWALIDPTVYVVRSGILSRMGVGFLCILLLSEAIADWRIEG